MDELQRIVSRMESILKELQPHLVLVGIPLVIRRAFEKLCEETERAKHIGRNHKEIASIDSESGLITRTQALGTHIGSSDKRSTRYDCEKSPQAHNFPHPASPMTSAASPMTSFSVARSDDNTAGERAMELSVCDLGHTMAQTIVNLAEGPSFGGQIFVKDLEPFRWKDLIHSFKERENACHLGVRYERTSEVGCVKIVPDYGASFIIPDFAGEMKRPSMDDISQYLDNITAQAPDEPYPYYVGPRLSTHLDGIIHSGEGLSSSLAIPGINSVYDHLGSRGSGTAFHKEDAHLWSCNLTLHGWKAWIVIRDYHTSRFERLIRDTWPGRRCDQFVRHENILVGPTRLRDEGIDFDLRCTGVGEMMITKPHQYHAVVNITCCYAISTNFLPPQETFLSADVLVCDLCGLYPLKSKHIKVVSRTKTARKGGRIEKHSSTKGSGSRLGEDAALRRQNHQRHRRGQSIMKSQLLSAAEARLGKGSVEHETMALHRYFQDRDQLQYVPRFDTQAPPNSRVIKLVFAMCSRFAVSEFISLVRASRGPNDMMMLAKTNRSECGSIEDRIIQRLRNIKRSESCSNLHQLCVRIDELKLAEDLEKLRGGQLRTSGLRDLAAKAGISIDTLRRQRTRGNKWKSLCVPYGTLSFMVMSRDNPFDLTPHDYLEIASEPNNLRAFHELLRNEYVKTLSSAGHAFQDSLYGKLACKFIWEGSVDVDVSSLSVHELARVEEPVSDE